MDVLDKHEILKGYVRNQSGPENCIVERYRVEKDVKFYTKFLSDIKPIELQMSRHLEKQKGSD